jgi:hypothetical protein
VPLPRVRLRRALRSPALVVAELSGIVLAGVLGASLPQAGSAGPAALERLRAHGPVLTGVVDLFGLDHVFRSAWFLGLTLLAAVSLSVVLGDQVRRLKAQWNERLTPEAFRAAPFRVEFVRDRRDGPAAPSTTLETRGRIGLAGSPLFHLGVLSVIAAGALRALLSVDAQVDLLEGETLGTAEDAWPGQSRGILAKPFRVDEPLTLQRIRPDYYPNLDLKDLAVDLRLGAGPGTRTAEVGINREARLAGGRLFLGSDHGPAVLLAWGGRSGESRKAALLRSVARGRYEGGARSPGGAVVHLRVEVGRGGVRPASVEIRVVRDGALAAAGSLAPGSGVDLPGGERLSVVAMPWWATLRASRDPALPLAFSGFALTIAGATIIFAVVKVDTCVTVLPEGGRERVVVALKAHRFAPLFRERFEALVAAEGGPRG